MKTTSTFLLITIFILGCTFSPTDLLLDNGDNAEFSQDCIKVKISDQCCGFISLEIVEDVSPQFAQTFLRRNDDGTYQKKFEVWNYCYLENILTTNKYEDDEFEVRVSNDIEFRNNSHISCSNNCEVVCHQDYKRLRIVVCE